MRAQDLLRLIRARATLAPMAGASDYVYRLICAQMGCPVATTEMLSAKGYLISGDRQAVRELYMAAPGERLVLQIFGSEPDIMAEAAKRLTLPKNGDSPYCAVDINMGCPAHKITGGGAGSALLREPLLAERIVRAVVGGAGVPVTVKMRLGWNTKVHVDFAKRMEDAGAVALTVHGRTREQHYSGNVDKDAIAQVVRSVKIPVIGNGDVTDVASFKAMLEYTGCHAVAIGRGALGNPWIFREIEADIEGKSVSPPTLSQRIAMCMRHAGMLSAVKGEYIAIREMRKTAAYYLRGMHDAASGRRTVQETRTIEEMGEALRKWAYGYNDMGQI